jgi:hypothetical protein
METPKSDAAIRASFAQKGNRVVRMQCLELALRMPDHRDEKSVVKAAQAFENFITGTTEETK